jgi:hypothetical protein
MTISRQTKAQTVMVMWPDCGGTDVMYDGRVPYDDEKHVRRK